MHKEFFLNPYNFALMAMRHLVEFTDEYLRILKERTQFAGIINKRDIVIRVHLAKVILVSNQDGFGIEFPRMSFMSVTEYQRILKNVFH